LLGGDLVGRDEELRTLVKAVERSARIVCVTGPSGVGKTALARALLGTCPGVFCSLEGADDENAVLSAVAAVLGVPLPLEEAGAREDRLLRALAARAPMVVVVDAAERRADLIDRMLARWAGQTPPGLCFLATTQVRLPSAKPAMVLESLALPNANETNRERALASPAVRLFVDRAAQRSGFVLDDRDVADVVAIVRALDGLPLALLLAAARVGLLGVARTRELLAKRFELLVGHEGLDPRHRSLAGAIAWSWDLLDARQREAVAGASVFRGGFTLDAANAVIGARDAGELETLGLIEGLLATSMLVLLAPPSGGRGARFGLYESVRDFARGATTGDLVRSAERRHAKFFVEAARTWAARVTTSEGGSARRWLGEEQSNVLAASEFEEAAGDSVAALRAGLALEAVYLTRGPIAEYTQRMNRLLAALPMAEAGEISLLRARTVHTLGLADIVAGRRPESVRHFKEALALAEEARAPGVAAFAATKAALILGLTGSVDESVAFSVRAESFANEAKDPHLIGLVAKDRGMVLSESGANAAAIESFYAALAGFRAAGDAREEGFTLAAIGARYLDDGALAEAKRHITRALTRLETIGDQRTQGWSHLLLAIAALEETHAGEAQVHGEQALACVRAVGDRLTEGLVLSMLGNVAAEAGKLAEAMERYGQAAQLLEAASDERNAAIALGAWSAVAAAAGEMAEAKRLLARANAFAAARGRPGDLVAIELFAVVVRCREAEDAAARGDTQAAESTMRKATELVATVSGAESRVHKSDEVRFALRAARRALVEATPRVQAMLSPSGDQDKPGGSQGTTGSAPFVVAEDGTWFRLPSGKVTKLRGKPVAGRLLRLLVDRALSAPGAPVPAVALIAAGWPGEKILPAAAQNRLYVAMTRLRRLGLGELLRNEGDGYFLSPSVPIRFAREA
jgi:predicted ATPase